MSVKSLLSCSLFLAFALVARAEEGKTYEITGVATGDTLNIRSGPGPTFPVVAKLLNGDGGIQIRGESVMNGKDEWTPITFQGLKGWTRSKFLAAAEAAGPAARPRIVEPAAAKAAPVQPSPEQAKDEEAPREAKSGEATPAPEEPAKAEVSAERLQTFYRMAGQKFGSYEKRKTMSPVFIGKIWADGVWKQREDLKLEPHFAAEVSAEAIIPKGGGRSPFLAVVTGTEGTYPGMMALTKEEIILAVKRPWNTSWTFWDDEGSQLLIVDGSKSEMWKGVDKPAKAAPR
jgi:uncharacterized protein YraI